MDYYNFLNTIYLTFSSLYGDFPTILVWVLGIGLALNHRQQSPQKARLTIIACVGFLAVIFIGLALQTCTFYLLSSNSIESSLYESMSESIRFVQTLFNAGLWVLLLIALFGKENVIEKAPEMLG